MLHPGQAGQDLLVPLDLAVDAADEAVLLGELGLAIVHGQRLELMEGLD